jgi:flagellar biosynthesis chaperone FliJ
MDLSTWTDDPHVSAYLRRQYPNMSLVSAAETEAYGSFMSKLHTIATKYNRTIVHWEGKTQDARR